MADKMFDPKAHGGGSGDADLPSGEYFLVLRWFERRTSKKNTPYLRCKYAIIHGPKAGTEFFANLSIDASNEGAAGRLSVFCAAVGVSEAFSLDDDEALRRLFINKPFKARLSRKADGQYINHDIERYLLKVSDAERKLMDGWVLDEQEAEAMGERRGGSRGGGGAFVDDDIPF
jgi:hypothetical protein